MKRRFRFVLAGAFALLSVMLCVLYGQQVRSEAERMRAEALERYGGEVVTLVVAAEGLEAGDVVSKQNTVEKDWVSDLAPSEAVLSQDSVMGAEVTVPVAAGVPLTALNFRDDEGSLEVPSGCVALSLPVTEKTALPASAGVGTLLVAYEVRDEGTRIVAARLEILRATGGEQGTVGSRAAITVAVSPNEVAAVLAASAEGTLRLALPADDVADLGSASGKAEAPRDVPAESGTDTDAGSGEAGDAKEGES